MAVYAVQYNYKPNSDPVRDEVRPSHRAWLAERNEEGKLLASGPYVGAPAALLIWEAEDVDSLKELIAQDPFAVHDIIETTDIYEWKNHFGPWV